MANASFLHPGSSKRHNIIISTLSGSTNWPESQDKTQVERAVNLHNFPSLSVGHLVGVGNLAQMRGGANPNTTMQIRRLANTHTE